MGINPLLLISNKFILFVVFISNLIFLFSQEQIVIAPELTEDDLFQFIRYNYTTETVQGYDNARDIIYSNIDNNSDIITCVYSGYSIEINGTYCNCQDALDGCSALYDINNCLSFGGNWIIEDDPSVEAYYKGINIEHTWPQSYGADTGNPKADMHHLFPTKSNVNASRGNDPFAEIEDIVTHKWYRGIEMLTQIPNENIDEYAEKFNPENQPELETFEPREMQKGNTARAMFYFFTIYNDVAPQFFWDEQIPVLMSWHYQDPVDYIEYERSNNIANYQNDIPNPFVLDSTLARRIWFNFQQSEGTQVSFQNSQIIFQEESGEVDIELQIFNPSNNYSTWCSLILEYGSANEEDILFNQQIIEFEAGIDQNQIISLDIIDDDIYEGEENISLYISDIWGGISDTASIGNPGSVIIIIEDNDLPNLIITEVMVNPYVVNDIYGEWFEIFNSSLSPIDLYNWTIKDGGTDNYIINDHIQIDGLSYFTFARESDFTLNGGVESNHVYSGIELGNNGDELILISPEGVTADSIVWDNGSLYPFSSGVSMSLIDLSFDNSNYGSWTGSNIIFGQGDYGTPGLENCFFPNQFDECDVCDGDGSSCIDLIQGDVNIDGIVNVVDVVLIVNFILGQIVDLNEEAADLNGDYFINIVDVVGIVNIILDQ